MDIKEIKELLELIQTSGIEEFEMEESGVRLHIRNKPHQPMPTPVLAPGQTLVVTPEAQQTSPPVEAEEEDDGLFVFTAPIVGTFYITPKPDAEPFVQVGDKVSKSTILCIIEAMKIFNQIESDVTGEIVEVLVENGQPVEFGEALFKIRLR
ncbi:MAG TPA: acetyl-CoA carboxylase biotin carboxyl carrier protein [Acidobacteriota bacterium]|nr:acetyl-CoA carboxylase biotin carboxyl carrier protein [Acidobacteriota bacterium]